MTSVPTDAILLDAAAPLLQPRDLPRRLPDVVTGGVDALLATAGALEGFRSTMIVRQFYARVRRDLGRLNDGLDWQTHRR
jgi:hypothetical protein